MSVKQKVIALDGPSGSGKSTVAKLLAKELGIIYIDTGSMFRSIGTVLADQKLLDSSPDKIAEFLKTADFQYAPSESILVSFGGGDFSQKIREHHVSALASQVSQKPEVRTFVETWEKKIVASRWAILDGRDIGTVIFPEASLKFFITATPMVRTNRRLKELQLKSPKETFTYAQIYKDIVDRDHQDMTRKIAPLKLADDAVLVDTSFMSIIDVVTLLKNYYKGLPC